MRCLAVCQTELAIRMLDEILLPSFEVEFLVESKPVARRLHESGLHVTAADLRRTDSYLKADLTPGTCVVVEDNGKRSLKKILEAIWDAGGTLVYVLGIGAPQTRKREEDLKAQFPELNYLALSELFGGPLLTEFSRSLTRLKVQQYQRFFTDADRVVIVLHNDPDPDAMASASRCATSLRAQADGGAGGTPGRDAPENQRMMNLLDIQVEILTPDQIVSFDALPWWMSSPMPSAGIIDRVDLVIDHHPEQPGYNLGLQGHPRRLRIRPSTILTEHLRAIDINISSGRPPRCCTPSSPTRCSSTARRTAWTSRRSRTLYPLADATLIRKMEGAEITLTVWSSS
jgi:hypothetical protein